MLDEWKLTVKSAALSGQVVLDRRMLLVKRPGAVAQTLGVSRLSNLSCELCLSKLDAPDAEVETSRKATNTSRLLALSHRPLYSNTTRSGNVCCLSFDWIGTLEWLALYALCARSRHVPKRQLRLACLSTCCYSEAPSWMASITKRQGRIWCRQKA